MHGVNVSIELNSSDVQNIISQDLKISPHSTGDISELINYRINLLASGYINQICHYLIIISDDIIQLISIWLIIAPPLRIEFDTNHYKDKLRVSLNRDIAWFMPVHFNVNFIKNLRQNHCQALNEAEHPKSHSTPQELLLYLLDDAKDIKMTTIKRDIIGFGTDISIEYPRNTLHIIYQIHLMDNFYNILAKTDWKYHKIAINNNTLPPLPSTFADAYFHNNSPNQTVHPSLMSIQNNYYNQQQRMMYADIYHERNFNSNENFKIDTKAKPLGINHSDSAKKIWMNSCWANNKKIARLKDLYIDLMKEFEHLTKCRIKQPTLEQIEYFCIKHGGEYMEDFRGKYVKINANRFDQFFAWFEAMCYIIKDLRHIYEQNAYRDPLIGLFYSRNVCKLFFSHVVW